ncbi:hypothetical protein MMC30_008199 [Trapelia coarctata]|nr:hypothetical protein [Trapelia coarctata]
MSNAKAYLDTPPALESRSLNDLCNNFADGFCHLTERCSWRDTHVITRIDGTTPAKQTLITTPNILSLAPRKTLRNNEYDNDGPGALSSSGTPRHDNDHVSIQDIQILPTTDEILSKRRPYMPLKSNDRSNAHRLPPGPDRLMDVSFRHQRYENTETLIDGCYHGMQQLWESKTRPSTIEYQYTLETPNGNRYSLFRNVAFEELSFHESKGAVVRLSFDCPKYLQDMQIHKHPVLERGMLCALIGIHDGTDELTTTFFQVDVKQGTLAMKPITGNHTRASVMLSFADPEDTASVRRSAYYMHGLIKASFVLADFPTVLLTGFWHHLKRLQKLADNPNFVFSSKIAPTSTLGSKAIQPPSYASKEGFEYNLAGIQSERVNGSTFSIRPMHPDTTEVESNATLEELKSKTTLDQGQAVALYESLSRELAMTQGPPGTGKTFLGVSLTRVILDSQEKSHPKPILVAAQTNRACDDFLKDVMEKGMKIARLGGGSKEDWIIPYTLHPLCGKMKMTQMEGANAYSARLPLEHLAKDGLGWAESLSTQMLGWHSLKDHLKAYHRDIYDHFADLEKLDRYEAADVRKVKRYSGFAYEFWVGGGDIKDITSLLEVLDRLLGEGQPAEETSSSASAELKERIMASVKRNTDTIPPGTGKPGNVWSLSLPDRHALVASWIQELNPWKVCDGFAEVHRRHQVAFQRKKTVMRPYLARCISSQQVIGVTTTGLVQHWDVLEEVKLRTVIVEEAPECLESHILSALFPSVQHAIFIGDPLQLRPLINTQALSAEYSPKYRLDESTFERLMLEGVPISRLTVQRRMHPDIADLSRAGDYPYLTDHESTLSHPPISGLNDRLYWFNHRQPESRPDPRSPMAKSHSNRFEVEFCAGMVRYLIEQNGYKLGDIVIITPYNGQLAALTARLGEHCTVRLTDNDRNTLLDEGLLQPGDINPGTSEGSVLLSDMLRIASVDSFQGMEAAIIIFSAVRSNDVGKLGFVATRNRINVACSRARDGFYILGNAELLGNVDHWAKRIDVFKEKDLIGSSFRASCPRHPEKIHEIHEPEQFSQIPTCSIPCAETLPCGHECTETMAAVNFHAPEFATRAPNLADAVDATIGSPAQWSAAYHVTVFHARNHARSSFGVVSTFVRDFVRKPVYGSAFSFTVKELDAALNIKDYYPVDENGTTKARGVSKIPSPESLQCPDCSRAVCNVERYALATQLQDMIPTIDRYYAKMGRKLAAAVGELFNTGASLRRSSEGFCQQLQTGVIFGMKNQRLVVERGNMMLELQQHVTRFHDEIVIPFEDNLKRLVTFVNNPDIFGEVVPTFQFRYRLVYYLCRLVTLEDGLRVFQHLGTLGELDRHTSTLMEGLKAKIMDHALAELKSLDSTIADAKVAKLPRLEVELRIVQLGLYLILRSMAVDSGVDLKTSSEAVQLLMERYPDTAGKMIGPFREVEARMRNGALRASFLDVYGGGSKEMVRALGKHQVGALKHCDNHHLHSSATFPSCPECGREVKVAAREIFQDAKELATSEAFMAKAKTLLVSGRFASGLAGYRKK